MGCAASEDHGSHLTPETASGIPEAFLGTWHDDHCELLLSPSGIEWRGPASSYDDRTVSIFTMEWTMQPSQEDPGANDTWPQHSTK